MAIENPEQALVLVVSILKANGFRDIHSIKVNHDRHAKITAINPMTDTRQAFYVKFEDEPFHLAARLHAKDGFTGEGPALTINKEWARYAKTFGCTILFVKPEGKIYAMDAAEFWRMAVAEHTHPNGEVVKLIPVEDVDLWALTLPEKTMEDSDAGLNKKEQKASDMWRDYWDKIDEWKSLPMLKCHLCDFRSVYEQSLSHHMTYTHAHANS